MIAMIRRTVLTTCLASSLAVVGCATGTEEPLESDTSSSADDEGALAQAKQELLVACDNDVPATGFVTFPYNQVDYGANSGWKSGCVGFRVNRNLPFPSNVPAEAEALGDFPQFEGTWTAQKSAQCAASYIEGGFAEKPGPGGEYVTDRGIGKEYAVPHVVFDESSPTLLRITSCRAQKWMGAGCSWHPQYNYQRIDVRAVVNGNPSTPIGPARVHAMFRNDTWC